MATYYVDGAVGSDDSSNDGLSEGAGNAWATIDHAMNNVIAGDHVYVKASATYDENAIVETFGTNESMIIFEGYTSTPGDNGHCIHKNTGGIALSDSVSNAFYLFKNFDWNGSSSTGVNVSLSSCVFYNCKFRNNGGDGVSNSGSNVSYVNCEFSGNTSDGVGNAALYHNFFP